VVGRVTLPPGTPTYTRDNQNKEQTNKKKKQKIKENKRKNKIGDGHIK